LLLAAFFRSFFFVAFRVFFAAMGVLSGASVAICRFDRQPVR
jgi:hypothetical protein